MGQVIHVDEPGLHVVKLGRQMVQDGAVQAIRVRVDKLGRQSGAGQAIRRTRDSCSRGRAWLIGGWTSDRVLHRVRVDRACGTSNSFVRGPFSWIFTYAVVLK